MQSRGVAVEARGQGAIALTLLSPDRRPTTTERREGDVTRYDIRRYVCERCGKQAETQSPDQPEGWRKIGVFPEGKPDASREVNGYYSVHLCPLCADYIVEDIQAHD